MAHPRRITYQYFIPFYDGVTVRCVFLAQFVYPLIS